MVYHYNIDNDITRFRIGHTNVSVSPQLPRFRSREIGVYRGIYHVVGRRRRIQRCPYTDTGRARTGMTARE